VYIKNLLTTPPNMVHNPLGSRHGLKATALNCGQDKQVRYFRIFYHTNQLIKMTFKNTNSSIGGIVAFDFFVSDE